MPPQQSVDVELNTWKEIADYLGKSVRTVQEWEQKRGLPVKRMGERGRVVALKNELDAWKERQLASSSPANATFNTVAPVKIEAVEAPSSAPRRKLPKRKLLAAAIAAAVITPH